MPDILDYCKGRKAENFPSGTVLIKEGGEERKLFVLIEGQVEILRQDTQVSYVEEPGSMFGEMSCLLDMPYTANVKALSDVNRLRIVQRTDPRGYDYYWFGLGPMVQTPGHSTDLEAIADGYVTVSPLHLDLTHEGSLDALQKRFAAAP